MTSWWLPLEYRRIWTVLSIVLVATVVYGSLAPAGIELVQDIGDKWQHGTTYFVLAAWFAGLAPRRNYPWIVSGLLLLGLSLELLQYAMAEEHIADAHRVADPRDMAANTAGIIAGTIAAYVGLGTWAVRVEAWLSRGT
jgi:hypothetical protein